MLKRITRYTTIVNRHRNRSKKLLIYFHVSLSTFSFFSCVPYAGPFSAYRFNIMEGVQLMSNRNPALRCAGIPSFSFFQKDVSYRFLCSFCHSSNARWLSRLNHADLLLYLLAMFKMTWRYLSEREKEILNDHIRYYIKMVKRGKNSLLEVRRCNNRWSYWRIFCRDDNYK